MGRTRDLFKKIRDTKGTFHAKTRTIKDRNGMDLTEVEDIKKRWQEYPEELYKKELYAGQEATVRTGHGTTHWLQIGKSTSRLYIVTLLI